MPTTPSRASRALLALSAVALLAGCGPGAAARTGQVSLTVTRDFGVRQVASAPADVEGSTTALRLLQTAGPVASGVAGVESVAGIRGPWALYVNGVRAKRTGTPKVRPGDRVWWDLRPAGALSDIRSVVGSFPEPFVHGVAGKRVPTRVECSDPAAEVCNEVADRLTKLGVVAARGETGAGSNDETLRVLVGTWRSLRAEHDDAVAAVDAGPARSGVFARFDGAGTSLDVLDPSGAVARTLGAGTGLIATTRILDREPVWFVTGTDDAGVESAARALEESALADSYALAVSDDRAVQVPARGP
jgi:hypothetical protein